jgi:hypothetical protein
MRILYYQGLSITPPSIFMVLVRLSLLATLVRNLLVLHINSVVIYTKNFHVFSLLHDNVIGLGIRLH